MKKQHNLDKEEHLPLLTNLVDKMVKMGDNSDPTYKIIKECNKLKREWMKSERDKKSEDNEDKETI